MMRLQLDLSTPTLPPRRAMLAAAAALAATLTLGQFGEGTAPGLWTLAGSLPARETLPLLALALVGAVGILTWHGARLTVEPVRVADAALAPALAALALLPGLTAAAIFVPALIAFGHSQRTVAQLVQCGALLTLAGFANHPLGHACASVTILATAGLCLYRPARAASNDNPQLERADHDSWLLARRAYAREARDS